jgi:hypothetical protein
MQMLLAEVRLHPLHMHQPRLARQKLEVQAMHV